MYRIIDTRGSGKTGRLMLLAQENNGVLVCSDPHSMRIKAHAYGLKGFDIISYYDFIDKNYDTIKPCYIDELEIFVKNSFESFIQGYTLSVE